MHCWPSELKFCVQKKQTPWHVTHCSSNLHILLQLQLGAIVTHNCWSSPCLVPGCCCCNNGWCFLTVIIPVEKLGLSWNLKNMSPFEIHPECFIYQVIPFPKLCKTLPSETFFPAIPPCMHGSDVPPMTAILICCNSFSLSTIPLALTLSPVQLANTNESMSKSCSQQWHSYCCPLCFFLCYWQP